MRKEYTKAELANMLSTAIKIAVDAHLGQVDRGGNPYIEHPLKVMYKLKTDDSELKAIAVLHDAIEDNKNLTYEHLREAGLSERIIEGIRCMTKVPGQTPEEYQTQVMSNIDSMKVKSEDLRHNSDLKRLKGIREKDIERAAKYMKFYYAIQQRLIEIEAQS